MTCLVYYWLLIYTIMTSYKPLSSNAVTFYNKFSSYNTLSCYNMTSYNMYSVTYVHDLIQHAVKL